MTKLFLYSTIVYIEKGFDNDKQINEIKISVLEDLYNILKSSPYVFDDNYTTGRLFIGNLKLKIEEFENE